MMFPPSLRAIIVSLTMLSLYPESLQAHSAVDVDPLRQKWGFQMAYSGVNTFANLRHTECLLDPDEAFDGEHCGNYSITPMRNSDIAIIGAPFDTAVTYRPGARFGPRAIRAASCRQSSHRGFNPRAGLNPYTSWATIRDCGDIPITPFDNALALTQMSEAFLELSLRSGTRSEGTSPAGDSRPPRLVTLGGDHSIVLPALRALHKSYGQPVAVIHFDAHLDTWRPTLYPPAWQSDTSAFTHGSMFWLASQEGLILNGSSVHAGLRTRLSGDGSEDLLDDDRQGFLKLSSDDIDDFGVQGVVERILGRIEKDVPVYLSVDIDVIDPGLAPGTGTPEPGGWTTREVIRILRGIEGLNLVGADVVEVAPAYDDKGEGTALAAAQLVYEIVTSMVKRGLGSPNDIIRDKDEL